MKMPNLVNSEVLAPDGTRLACQSTLSASGASSQGQVPILLCNGLGGSWMAWVHQIRYLEDRFPMFSWDYRGLYGSGSPSNPDALHVEDHASDGLAVADSVSADGPVILLGWSLGVQVALEMFRKSPTRVAAMVLVNGVPGTPFSSAMPSIPGLQTMIPNILRSVGRMPRLAQGITKRITRMPESVQWIKRMGLASKTLDDDLFYTLASSFGELDMTTYMRILEFTGAHDATDMLNDVDVPVLVISGDRDRLTPRRVAEDMARKIQGAESLVVKGGTHYVAVEYPDLVNLRIEKFFRERGLLSQGRVDENGIHSN